MSANSNVELIRDAYEAFIKGDLETVDRAFADNVVFRVLGRNPLAGVRHTKQEVFGFFGELSERTGGTFQLEVHNVLGGDDQVVVLVTERGERNGKRLESPSAHVWRVEDGRAVEFVALYEDPYAGDDFWS
jgi:uncharacterized protein